MSMQKLFQNKEYCIEELYRIREMFSDKKTLNSGNIDAGRETLAWMWVYCPAEIQNLVEATQLELDKRELLYLWKV